MLLYNKHNANEASVPPNSTCPPISNQLYFHGRFMILQSKFLWADISLKLCTITIQSITYLCSIGKLATFFAYLVRRVDFLDMHLPQHIISGAQCSHFRVADFNIRRQADEPQAIAMPQQTSGPHLGDGWVLSGYFMSWPDFLQKGKKQQLFHPCTQT